MIELIFLGIGVGILSGFFGIGGGTILIPLLLILGYEIKTAIGISVVQMVFSSVYGSYLNNKKGTLNVYMISMIGAGGFIGALFSGSIASSLQNKTLEIIFLVFALFALIKMFFSNVKKSKNKSFNKFFLFFIGLLLGAFSMTIGVGGSILLVPILVGFFNVKLKEAISGGLFFVVFSSIAGLISHSRLENIDFESGLIIGFASLFGVHLGILLKDIINTKTQRKLLIVFYLLIVIYLINRVF